MKKFFLASFFTLLSICTYAYGYGYGFEVDGIYYNITGENTVKVAGRKYAGSIVIPNKVMYDSKEYSVTSIGDAAFYGCSDLTSINIPEGVTSIGGAAFYNCSNLTSINIPEGVTSIGRMAFYNYYSTPPTRGVRDIFCYGSTPVALSGSIFSSYTITKGTLHVPYGTIENYKAADYWKRFANIVEFDPTDVEAVSADKKADAERKIYTLGGVWIAAPQKGLNIINGKKVVY